MTTTRIMAAMALIVGSGVALYAVTAQPSGIKRTDLLRQDLSVPGREVVQGRSSPRTSSKRGSRSSRW